MVANRSLRESFGLAGAVGATSAAGEAVRREVARKLSRDSEEMQEVIAYGARFLHANPREIKRFANVFRFLVMIATERRLAELDAPDELGVLAKLAVLSTRWPSVVAQLTWPLAADPTHTVFDLLEDPPRSGANGAARRAAADRRSLERALAGSGLSAGVTERLLGEDLRQFMCAEPRVGASARGWL
jgi:hypothetical protein